MTSKIDWDVQAKKESEPLNPKAKRLREEFKRSLLLSVAPTYQLNEWFRTAPEAEPLLTLSLSAARGLLELVEKPHDNTLWGPLYKDWSRIKARLKTTQET